MGKWDLGTEISVKIFKKKKIHYRIKYIKLEQDKTWASQIRKQVMRSGLKGKSATDKVY